MQKTRNAIVVRVSAQGDREEENFHAPTIQLAKAKQWSKDRGERVAATFEEIDVSGKLPLAKRPGLLQAIEMVEAGEVDHIVVAYFDRLVRSLKVQLEVIERVEQAGGEIFAIDHGKLTNGTAATRMSTSMMGAAFQFYAEVTGEKVAEAQERAVRRGVLPHPKVPPGYVRGADGVLLRDREVVPVVVEAFERRDRGATLSQVQTFLAEHGIERTIAGVQSLLRSRIVLGEIHFGKLHNLHAHEPIVDRALFERVQRRAVMRGRQAKSERLLARLGVLRCETCGSRMVINSYSGNYRCGDTSANGCERRAAIKADGVEAMVIDAVRAYMADEKGRASAEAHVRETEAALDRAKANLAAAFRTFAGYEHEEGARERIAELAQTRDEAQALVDQLGRGSEAVERSAEDWDTLTLAGRRDLIRATVESVTVAPAASRQWDATRIEIKLFRQG